MAGKVDVTVSYLILIVSTGKETEGAATYRRRITSKTSLNIVIIDGDALNAIVKDPASIVTILNAQANDAMQLKPLPKSLAKGPAETGGPNGGESKISSQKVSKGSAKKSDDDDEQPRLFKPAYSTGMGEMYQGDSYEILKSLIAQGVRVKLLVTSPPFALIRKKEYGNEAQEEYVAWFMRFVPLFQQILEPGGSFVMDIGGTWIPGIPARSIYQYRLLIRLCESGFYLAQEFYHYNPARLPSPAEWVTVRRIRVKDAVNNVWWFVRDPFVDADNRQVLQEYSPSMKQLLKSGYKAKMRPSGHDISEGFNNDRGGSIPPNLLQLANTESNSHYLRSCRTAGIKPHPARFPSELPSFFIKMLTKQGDIVLDTFAGSNVTGQAAESLGRRWISMELSPEYVAGSQFRFDPPEEVAAKKTEARQARVPKKVVEVPPLFLMKQIADAEQKALSQANGTLQ